MVFGFCRVCRHAYRVNHRTHAGIVGRFVGVRIMHIAWEYPPLVYGGLGRHVYALAGQQAALGHQVTVITQQLDNHPREEFDGQVRVVRRSPTPGLDFVPDNLLQWVGELDRSLANSAVAEVGVQPQDVIHAHDWMTTTAGEEAARAAGAPLVATIHATERGRHQGHLPGAISMSVDATERQLCRCADAIIACSPAMRTDIMEQLDADPAKITVVPNGIDVPSWTASESERAEAKARWGGSGPLLVFTGRLEVEKGIYTLLDAMAAIRATHPRARLIVVGQGGQERYFDADIARHGLSATVIRAGWLGERELRGLIAAADVAIVPSLYEPFGMVALEAVSLGAPLVVAATGGLTSIVDDGRTGLTFTPGDPHSLAEAVLAVLADPQAARERAVTAQGELSSRFDWRTIAADTVAVYQRALDR